MNTRPQIGELLKVVFHLRLMSEFTTHQTLLKRLSSGQDLDAWSEFSRRYGPLIRGMARRQGLQAADCDEIVQEVLSSLVKAMETFEYDPAKGKFRGYLKTITVRAIMAKRKETSPALASGNIEDSATMETDLDRAWENEWRQYHLRIAMETVSREFNPLDRAVFDAYAIRGQPAAATSEIFEVSVDQVYQAKSRILKRLEELIELQILEEG